MILKHNSDTRMIQSRNKQNNKTIDYHSSARYEHDDIMRTIDIIIHINFQAKELRNTGCLNNKIFSNHKIPGYLNDSAVLYTEIYI